SAFFMHNVEGTKPNGIPEFLKGPPPPPDSRRVFTDGAGREYWHASDSPPGAANYQKDIVSFASQIVGAIKPVSPPQEFAAVLYRERAWDNKAPSVQGAKKGGTHLDRLKDALVQEVRNKGQSEINKLKQVFTYGEGKSKKRLFSDAEIAAIKPA